MTDDARARVVRELADPLLRLPASRPIRVGIDGRTASGKTTLADELGTALASAGRPVIRTSVDGFHRPHAQRYARGRHSAEGYYFDARDLGAIRALLLDPLGPGGDRMYRTASFDLATDTPVEETPTIAPANAILIVDGTFLQRPELASGWDVVVFVDVPETVAAARGVARDAQALGGEHATRRLYVERYQPANAIYVGQCNPRGDADAVLDNEYLDAPRLQLRPGGRLAR
jgi:uridine kinase